MTQFQIHIAGPPRSGKSTLARNLKYRLDIIGRKTVIVDIDETRAKIFEDSLPSIGSQLHGLMQFWAYNAVFELRIKDILASGASPVVTAVYSRPEKVYHRAKIIADQMGAEFRFIVIEETSFEEMVRRCLKDKSYSDMRDPLNNTAERKSWEDVAGRFKAAYADFKEPHCMIKQGTPEEMAYHAFNFIYTQGA